jgi:hypothetical protein
VSERERRVCKFAAYAIAALVPALYYADAILAMFYVHGAPYDDLGLFAQVVHRNDLALSSPPAHIGVGYFHTHVAPALVVVTGLSWLVPLDATAFYAAFYAAIHGLLAVALVHALISIGGLGHSGARSRVAGELALAAAIGIALALSAIPANAAWLGHYEMVIPALVLLFFVFLVRGRTLAAAIALGSLLALREDAGLHVAVLLVPLLFLDRAHAPSDLRRRARTFAAIAVLGSTLAFAIHAVFLSGHDVFGLVYAGDPPFAHLTLEELGARLSFIVVHRPYLWAPAVLALVFAARTRDAHLAAGWLAQLPWLALQLSAAHESIARLYAHYPFPLLVSIGWPLVALGWRRGGDASQRERRTAIALTAACIALSLFGYWQDRGVVLAAASPEVGGLVAPAKLLRTRDATERFVDDIRARRTALGRIVATDTAVALAGDLVENQDRIRAHTAALPYVDAVLYFEGDPHAGEAREAARAHDLAIEEHPAGQRLVLLHR